MPLKITPAHELEISAGDFGVQVTTGGLMVPTELGGVLRRHNVRTAEQLVSYLRTFPSALAQELGWTVKDLQQAQEGLVSKLSGRVDPGILEPVAPLQVGYGALDPALFDDD
jgi:hypothetical protein